MRSLFNLDSPVMQFLSRVADILLLNLFWMICCIPVITIGASTTALYRVTITMAAKAEGGVFKSFFKAFKDNFKPATIVWLILLVPTALVTMNLWLLISGQLGQGLLMAVLCFIPLVILLCVCAYVFPYIALFENKVGLTIRNAALMSLAHLPKTLLMVVLNLFPIVVLLVTSEIATLEFALNLLFFWFLIGEGLVAYANGKLLWGIFKKYMPEDCELLATE